MKSDCNNNRNSTRQTYLTWQFVQIVSTDNRPWPFICVFKINNILSNFKSMFIIFPVSDHIQFLPLQAPKARMMVTGEVGRNLKDVAKWMK